MSFAALHRAQQISLRNGTYAIGRVSCHLSAVHDERDSEDRVGTKLRSPKAGISGQTCARTRVWVAMLARIGGTRSFTAVALSAIYLLVFLETLGNGATMIALPAIEDSVRAGFGSVGWVLTANLVFYGGFLIIAGRLADHNMRRALISGATLFAVSSLICALAPGIQLLILGRAGQGLGAAFFSAATFSVLANRLPAAKLGVALGVLYATIAAGDLLGPFVGGLATQALDWRWIYALQVPLVVLLLVAALVGLGTTSNPKGSADIPYINAALLVAGIALFIFALDRAEQWGLTLALLLVASALIVTALFSRTERRAARPLFDYTLARQRLFLGALVLRFLSSFAIIAVPFLAIAYLQNVLSYSPIEVGLRAVPLYGSVILFSTLAGKVVDLTGPRIPCILGFLALAGGFALASTLTTTTPYTQVLLPAFILIGGGFGLISAPVQTVAVALAGKERAGVAGGLLSTAGWLSSAIGLAVLNAAFRAVADGRFDSELASTGAQVSPHLRDVVANLVGTKGVGAELGHLDLATATSIDHAVRETYVTALSMVMQYVTGLALVGIPVALVMLARWRQRTGATVERQPWNRPRKIVLAVTVAAVLVGTALPLGLSVFRQPQPVAAFKVDGNTLVIYSSLALQGPLSEVDNDVLEAERMALAEHDGRVGGYSIELISLDDNTSQKQGSDAAQTAANAERAAADPRTIAYIGESNSGASAVSIPILNKAGILQISPTDTAIGLTSADAADPGSPEKYYPTSKRTFARVIPNDSAQAAAQLLYIRQSGAREVFMVHDADIYGRGLSNEFRQSASRKGISIVGNGELSADPTENEMLVNRVRDSGADAFMLEGVGSGNSIALIQELHAALPDLLIFGSDGVMEPAFAEGIGSAADSTYVTFPARKPGTYPEEGEAFFESFRKLHGRDPTAFAIYGYEAMSVVLDALASLGRDANNRADVIDAVFAIEDRESVLGAYSMNANGDTNLPYYGGYRIVDGHFVYDDRSAHSDGPP